MDLINDIVQEDTILNDEIKSGYSDMFINLLIDSWYSVCTSIIISQHLIANQARYRLAQRRPDQEMLDYWPFILREHFTMIKFIKTLLWEKFILTRTCIFINFTYDLFIVPDAEVEDSRYLYSSRSNFQALPTAYLIHDISSYHGFISRLKEFSLRIYVEGCIEKLCEKYDGIVLPVSIMFSFTRNIARVFGGKEKVEKPLTSSNGVLRCQNEKNNCLFEALSPFVKIDGKKITWLKNRKYSRLSLQRAEKVKILFLKWHKKKYGLESLHKPIEKGGFNSAFIMDLERFLCININIYALKEYVSLKLGNNGSFELLKRRGSQVFKKVFYKERISSMLYKNTVDLVAHGQHILSITKHQKLCGYVCAECHQTIEKQHGLLKHKCKKNYRFLGETQMDMPTNLYFALIQLDENFKLTSEPSFVNINVVFINNLFTTEIRETLNENKIISKEFKSSSILESATFIVNYASELSRIVLEKRLIENLEILKNFEKKLNLVKSAGNHFKRHQNSLEEVAIIKIEGNLMGYLKTLRCYIATAKSCGTLLDCLMINILTILNKDHGKTNLTTRFTRGQLSMITATNSRVEFCALNNISSSLISQRMLGSNIIHEVVFMFHKNFAIDITLAKSLTEIGSALLNQSLSKADSLSFISPSKKLFIELEKMIKFGIIGSRKMAVSSSLKYRSIISLDVVKFYLNCLKLARLPVGIGLFYQKDSEETFKTKPNRSRGVYSNLLFSFLNSILDTGNSIYSKIQGKELRYGKNSLPVDAMLFYKDGSKKVIQFLGCYFHCHFASEIDDILDDRENRSCHFVDSTQHNKAICQVCINSESGKSNFLMPNLFRIKVGESILSPHPTIKGETYKTVYLKSKQTEKDNVGNSWNEFIRIKECSLISMFNNPLKMFAKKFLLPIRPELLDKNFGILFRDYVCNNFPLLRYNGKVKSQSLINMIKYEKINGFITCDCFFGPEGQKLLDIIRPFSFKTSNGAVHSFSGSRLCLPTVLVSYFLQNKNLEYAITKVYHFTEYHLTDIPPFEAMCKKILDVLDLYKNHAIFTNILKFCINSAIGRFGMKKSSFTRTFVLNKNDELSIHNLNNLICTSSVDSNISLFHFKNNSYDINLTHIHMWILSSGRKELIKIILSLMYNFENCVISCVNTDGFSLCSKVMIDKKYLYGKKDTCLYLDCFLKQNLSRKQIEQYVSLKLELFKKCGFCFKHKQRYIEVLNQKQLFLPEDCCLDYENKLTGPFTLKMEFVGDRGIFMAMNRSSFYDSYSKKRIVKCSGLSDDKLYNIANYSEKEINKFD